MDLSAYLDRIDFTGEPRPDLATLEQVQRRHLLAIPYENLDVLLGKPVSLDAAAAFDKLVRQRRGGWCYEMNGLFGWALFEMGFCVTRLASGVMRSAMGEDAVGNHLVLRVDLEDGPVLADVGLGDGPIHPFAIAEHAFNLGGFDYSVEAMEEGWWRLHNRAGARPPNFDFHTARTDEPLLARRCHFLQTDPASMFVQNLICQRMTDGGPVQLLGKVLRKTASAAVTERTLSSADELTDVLAVEFGIDEPAAADLWPAICARHAEVLG